MKTLPKNGKKILLTGGHAGTTAIAVVEELIRRKDRGFFGKIIWVGPKSAFEGKKVQSIESDVFPRLQIESFHINAGKLQTKFTRHTVSSIFKIPYGFLQSLLLILKIRPDLILSFGGFVALPLVLIGKAFRIPVVIHEQTAVAGRANLLPAKIADRILLSREQSRIYFPKQKSIVIGNPLMTQINEVPAPTKIGNPPTILVTGGSRGSKVINDNILVILHKLLKDFRLIHLVGEYDYNKFQNIFENLPEIEKKNYFMYSKVDPLQVDNLYRQSDIVIARSGANTVSEVIATKRPSIFIPLSFSYLDEQTKNAEFACRLGLARIIKENQLNPDILYAEIFILINDWSNVVQRTKAVFSPDVGASSRLVDILEGVLSENK
jgi:UDP-N-acetylglucosamine--N-acetylmuramyl-(pentapeptide) pyrophosphoryl-undecaprenol N-acetylglucosamine transferase